MADLSARWHQSIAEIDEQTWQALVAPHDLPYFNWTWLEAMEASGSITPRHGWQPLHLGIWRRSELVAVAPLYLKGHSYGEFVFDQPFAQLAGQLGLAYYPKLLGMSPLTPALGYRFFTAPTENALELTSLMLELVDDFCRRNSILSASFLYADPTWQELAETAGCAAWLHHQSLWSRDGQTCFADYLAGFNANQRRNIRRERKAVAGAGVTVTALAGDTIPDGLMARMYHFYSGHCERWGVWGSKYLSDDFFARAERDLRRHLVLFSAHRGDPLDPIGMSLCLRSGSQLWGRYWGSDEDVDCLHFETCYYAPIEWALREGISSFDPGAGGSHKKRRGFVARPHTSLHRWYQPGFEQLIRRWLPQANARMQAEIEAINAAVPFTSRPLPLNRRDPIDQILVS